MSLDDINSIKRGSKSRDTISKISPINGRSKAGLNLETIKDDINERFAKEITLMSRSS